MNILRLTWIQNWSYESAKNFCKLILDNGEIAYQEEDFKTYNLSHSNTKTCEIVKRYAKMYKDIYINTDQEKVLEMVHVIESCLKI